MSAYRNRVERTFIYKMGDLSIIVRCANNEKLRYGWCVEVGSVIIIRVMIVRSGEYSRDKPDDLSIVSVELVVMYMLASNWEFSTVIVGYGETRSHHSNVETADSPP